MLLLTWIIKINKINLYWNLPPQNERNAIAYNDMQAALEIILSTRIQQYDRCCYIFLRSGVSEELASIFLGIIISRLKPQSRHKMCNSSEINSLYRVGFHIEKIKSHHTHHIVNTQWLIRYSFETFFRIQILNIFVIV